ncbi:MAG: tetratricopeptide repeat protein [Isosphaeraceae bacterium]
MADADRTTCPRCGAPLPADVPAGLCPRRLLSDTQRSQSEDSPVSPSSPERVRRKRRLTLTSAVAAIGAILLGGLWFGSRRGRQPADAAAHYNRGVDLQEQGKLEEAIAEYRTAIRLQPDLALAHNNLGNALAGQGKLDEAVAASREAIRIKPDYAEAHYNLALVLKAQGKREETIAEFRTAVRIKPDFAEARHYLGSALQAQVAAGFAAPDDANVHLSGVAQQCLAVSDRFAPLNGRHAPGSPAPLAPRRSAKVLRPARCNRRRCTL